MQKLSPFHAQQLRGCIDADVSTKQQKVVPPSMFCTMLQHKFTPLDEILSEFIGGAYLFGMRNCEFMTFQGTRKIKRLKVRNIHFLKSNIETIDKTSPLIQYAGIVSITFEY